MRLYSKGVQPTLALFKALFVWLMWSLRASLRRGSFSRPWLGCKRWARVRFGWTRGRHACSVSANRAGAQNFWYVQPDCVNNRPVNPGGARGWPCANTDLCLATLLKTAVFVPFFLTRNAFIKTWNRCTFFASTFKRETFQRRTAALPQQQARAKWVRKRYTSQMSFSRTMRCC